MSLSKFKRLPKHIGIIPDGNRRWAEANKLTPTKGHEKGFEVFEEIAREARRLIHRPNRERAAIRFAKD